MTKFSNNNPNSDGDKDKKKPLKLKPPVIYEPRCQVCKSDYRMVIDKLLVVGVPAARIAEDFDNEGITRKSVSNHRAKHISIEERAIRQIVEDEARRTIGDIDDTKRSLVTMRSYMETALLKGFDAIVDDRITPEPRDVLQMINLMQKSDEKSSAIEKEELMREFNAFARAVQEIAPKHIWLEITERFEAILSLDDNLITQYGFDVTDIEGTLPQAELPPGDS